MREAIHDFYVAVASTPVFFSADVAKGENTTTKECRNKELIAVSSGFVVSC